VLRAGSNRSLARAQNKRWQGAEIIRLMQNLTGKRGALGDLSAPSPRHWCRYCPWRGRIVARNVVIHLSAIHPTRLLIFRCASSNQKGPRFGRPGSTVAIRCRQRLP